MKVFILFFFVLSISLSANVHTSYLWHLQQPIYWPEASNWDSYHYQTAWESYWLKMNGENIYDDGLAHPLNDLEAIFSNPDRVAVYQYRAKEAVQSLLHLAEAGAQVNYSGCLMENVESLALSNQWGYQTNWQEHFIDARSWTTSSGKPRMDIVGFTMHHAISPLLDETALRMQIRAHRHLYEAMFGSHPDYSKGYWPAECSFSERIIKVLVEEGFEWSVIANSHLARTLEDYPVVYGTNGCNIDPPNPADRNNLSGENWWSGEIDGRGGMFAAPFCYQAHRAQYVDPETGEIFQIIVVPMADFLSYMNGFGSMDTNIIDNGITPYDEADHPSMVLMAHDGDNAWGGGYSYYTESVPNFANLAHSMGYSPTTIEQFLHDHPVPEEDVVRVEDGSWFNAANDWGHPQFINWLWPMFTPSYEFDETGWTEDARNWAVITAAQNRVETAQDLEGYEIDIDSVVHPNHNSTLSERAWHHLLPAYTSGYMYYGTALDMEVKQTLACNIATNFADEVILETPNEDNTAPTVFIPQRYPYNPGGIGFGPTYQYQQHENDSDFTVWTFAYDVSGIQNATLYFRIDDDGENPIDDISNETYSGGTGVGSWQTVLMNERIFPAENVTNNPDIDFFLLPDYIANEYYAEISHLENVLVDYYVQVTDTFGNCKKTPIQHVFVGEYDGTNPSSYVWWEPENPTVSDTLTIYYGTDGNLYPSDPLYIHLGTNDWTNVQDFEMIPADTTWSYTFQIPTQTNSIDFVFTDLNGNWDNNSEADWHIVIENENENPFAMDGQLDMTAIEIAEFNGTHVYFQREDDFLYVATEKADYNTDIFLFLASQNTEISGAPWTKTGTVLNWDQYLANEGSNGFFDWFDDTNSEAAIGDILEGSIPISTQNENTIYLAVGIYETIDQGNLLNQCPAGNNDMNIDASEYIEIDLDEWVNQGENAIHAAFLLGNFPNPFNPSTKLYFQTANPLENCSLQIYNMKGQLVKTIFVNEKIQAGFYSFLWNGFDNQKRKVSSGIYLYQLKADHFLQTKKMMLLK